MNDDEKEYCLQVFCGIVALLFLTLVIIETNTNHESGPMNTPPRVDSEYAPGEEQRILERDKSAVNDINEIKAN